MEKLIKVTLFFHVLSGGIALLSGIFAIITKKGQKKHRLAGQFYFWSMFSVIITGLIVSTYRNNLFLQSIAVFSFYLAFTGKRVLRYKKEIQPETIDWVFNSLSMLVSLIMLFFAFKFFANIGFVGVAPILLVFGGLLFWMSVQDFLKMKRKVAHPNQWLLDHISRMGGSFIATSTAFLLINIRLEPVWVMWLLPTLIGTPLIAISSKKWKKKMTPKTSS